VSKSLSKAEGRFSETEIDGEVVLMNLAGGDFFSLTGTAMAIWRLIDGTRDRAALVAALAVEYDADEAAIAADVDAFLAMLETAEFLARA
jgi:pyrroloquinoline quinone biosynthesis protein D